MSLISAAPPQPVRYPVMTHQWRELLFIHWAMDPDTVARVLPRGLEPDTFEGRSYVGIIPFLLTIQPLGLPVAVLKDAPEINLRTYVRGPDGGTGIYFLSLDIGRRAMAAVARLTYSLPYMWSELRHERRGEHLLYGCHRNGGEARCDLEVEVGERIPAPALQPLDLFLTARWVLYTRAGRGVGRARVDHPAWELRRARVLRIDERLTEAVGLPRPTGPPLALYSPGLSSRFGLHRRVPSPVSARRLGNSSRSRVSSPS